MKSPDPARTLAAELEDATPGHHVTLLGHVHRRRELATVAFLIVRDRSGLAQVVVRPAQAPACGLPPEETVVRVT
ncbi:OB-fold nucleic acid binding domain-containing protein, partial [Mycobacterium tuberculosis]|uniref:OB-fold nucleic acid binding domain-containing protein n=1 Tax=Mycobacterium tuberculosis TaxID=1773 RepID=UPI001F1F7B8A